MLAVIMGENMSPGEGLTAIIVLNGSRPEPSGALPLIRSARWLIAADGGADWCYTQRLVPHLLVGDLDSISPEALAYCEAQGTRIVRHAPEKDETDAELALLEAYRLGASHILILGALGGRIDHALANIQLLAMPEIAGCQVSIFDDASYIWLAQHETEIQGQIGDVVSLIPWSGDVQDIVTAGLYYPLRHEPLRVGPARGVSNLLTQPVACVTWSEGKLLVVHTPQRSWAT
jgi:thiamine pyrophosphokinase